MTGDRSDNPPSDGPSEAGPAQLGVFRDLDVNAQPARGHDPDIFATVAITLGVVVLSIVGLVGLVVNGVVRTSAGYDAIDPVMIAHAIQITVSGLALIAIVAGGIALMRARRTGGQRRAMVGAAFGLGWLVVMIFYFAVPGDAVRVDGILVDQGWSTVPALAAGDCFKAVTAERYGAHESRVYAIPCELTHRAEVMYVFDLDTSTDTEQEILAAAREECDRTSHDAAVTISDAGRLVALSPTQQGREISGIGHVACVIAYDTPVKGNLAVTQHGAAGSAVRSRFYAAVT